MKTELVNQSVSVTFPDSFRVMKEKELHEMFRSNHSKTWGIRDENCHVLVVMLWEDYPLLLARLADLKALCRKNERLNRRMYGGRDYQCGGFRSLTVADQPAEGYSFSYSAGDIRQSAESVLFKKGRTIYSLICFGRAENRTPDQALFGEILKGIQK